MKKQLLKISFVCIAVLQIVACTKSETITTPEVTVSTKVVKDLMADTVLGIASNGRPYSAGKYTFYSLENNAIVPSTDSASAKWDLAFMSTTIITNGGTSGPALGGAFIYTGLFDDLKTIPADSIFKTDNAPTYAITKGWYTYDPLNNLITPLAGRVLVIRTASGKYAKLEITSYYKGGVTLPVSASELEKTTKQRYYNFRYTYQSNGSKVF
jgi:HmuY protein